MVLYDVCHNKVQKSHQQHKRRCHFVSMAGARQGLIKLQCESDVAIKSCEHSRQSNHGGIGRREEGSHFTFCGNHLQEHFFQAWWWSCWPSVTQLPSLDVSTHVTSWKRTKRLTPVARQPWNEFTGTASTSRARPTSPESGCQAGACHVTRNLARHRRSHSEHSRSLKNDANLS